MKWPVKENEMFLSTRTIALFALALACLGCGERDSASQGNLPEDNGTETGFLADTGFTEGGDAEAGELDTTGEDTTSADIDFPDDTDLPPDAPDTTPSIPLGAPLARVYENNPFDGKLLEVEMLNLSDPDGFLTGDFTKVWNCTQEDGTDLFGFAILCDQKQVAQAGEDNTFFHIPAALGTDGNDAFAELMMYYHVNAIHGYFADVHNLHDLDFPLTAIVNAQIKTGDQWQPFDNAAFIPEETWGAFPLPLEIGDGGAIVFGQGSQVDYAYEADVIYHEYTHAMIGTTRLSGYTFDSYGPDNSGGAMNEGFADYFAATLAEDPVMGAYALTGVGGMDLSRDLSILRSCPEDLTTEIHADGQLIGNAAWAMREAFGPMQADSVILRALANFTNDTNFAIAAQAIIAEAALEDPPIDEEVTAIFEERGLLNCQRVKDYDGKFVATGMSGSLPLSLAGTQETGLLPFQSSIPSFVQWRYTLPEDKAVLKVEFQIQVGGGGGMGGWGGESENPSLSIALKSGGEAILYDYSGGSATHDALFVVPMEDSPGTQEELTRYKAYLHGDCIEGGDTVTLQIHNSSGSGGNIYMVTLSGLDEAPEDALVNASGCAAP